MIPFWTLATDLPYGSFGFSVRPAGDVNGDGLADVVVGAPTASVLTGDPGSAHVYLGSAAGQPAPITIVGAFASGQLGYSVDGAGDVNGDGYDDVIVGAPMHDSFGWVGVFNGSPPGIDPTAPAWEVTSTQVDSRFGAAVAGVGDVNGDGFDDVVVAAHTWQNDDDDPFEPTGRVWLYLGSSAGLSSAAAWTVDGDLPSTCCFGSWGSYGKTLDSGDVDGDDLSDVVIGSGEDVVHVYHGEASGLPTTPSWTAVAQLAATLDADGDGYDDVVTLDDEGTTTGEAKLYRGTATGLEVAPAWSLAEAGFGASFTAAGGGDLDGDGYDDLVLGMEEWDDPLICPYAPCVSSVGLVSVYAGSPGGPGLEPLCEATAGSYDDFGHDVAVLGDVTGDGGVAFAIGAPNTVGASGTAVGLAGVFAGSACFDGDADGIRDDVDACFGDDASLDLDLDGFCARSATGAVEDCDDADSRSWPGADELCDGIDNACTGAVPADERDDDADGAIPCAGDCDDADPTAWTGAIELCDGVDNACVGGVPPDEQDADGDGYRICDGDCNDWYAEDYPEAVELCDGFDNACAGTLAADESDADGDGVAPCGGDCDDADVTAFPGASERCDGIDNACAGFVPPDEVDADGDGVALCADCDDGDAATFPGAAETCDGRANSCVEGGVPPGETDADGDGRLPCEGDCDDLDGAASPDAAEVCGDHVDNDCDLAVDEDCGTSEAARGCATVPAPGPLTLGVLALLRRRRSVALLLVCAAPAARASEPPAPTLWWESGAGVAGSYFGGSVSGLPDRDGDGADDLVVGARNTLPDGFAVTFEGPDLLPDWSWSHDSFDAIGDAIYQFRDYGWTVTGADLNGDGAGEWVVAGDGWVGVYARTPLGGSLLVADFGCGNQNFWYVGMDSFGQSLAAGDVDGDGYGDLAIGAPEGHDCLGGAPSVYVFRGAAEAMSEEPAWQLDLDLGPADSLFGHSVAVLDVNGDGFGDVVVGAPGAGRVFVFHGSAAGLAGAPSTELPPSDGLGWAVAGLGDVNGDGYGDVAVSTTPGEISRVEVHHGSRLGIEDAPALGLATPEPGSHFGAALAGAGDVNADGYADLLVGAPRADDGAGMALLYAGSAAGIVSTPVWTGASVTAGALYGTSVAGGVDVNADGYDDIVVGAPFGSIAIALEGTVHVYAGAPFLVPETDPCSDTDGDGATGCAGDCDDLDATSFPGAAEVCDGRDNRCAGEVEASELDADADGSLPCAGDCDDTTSSVAPALAEICGDLADNDCDGTSDEDCPRAPVDEAGCGCAAPSGGGGASVLVAAAALFTRLARRRVPPVAARGESRHGEGP